MTSLRLAPVAAALAAACLIGFATATPASADPPPLHGHGPVQPHRKDDGSLERGPHFEILTSNWAGYAVANFQTGQRYTAARASWTVAPVSFGQTLSQDSDEYAASWVGIGGYCTNALCTSGDNSLIQLGTQSEVSQDGTATYGAWYELLPQLPVAIPLEIHPGDQITAALDCLGPCLGKKQAWTLSMTDLSTNQSWSKTVAYGSSLLSVEWIEEAPVMGGVLPLADFSIASFSAATANGSAPAITLADNGIVMFDPYGQFANISAPGAFNAFNACWGFLAVTACPTP